MQGRLISDVLPADAFSLLEARYREVLVGIERDADYRSPVDGNLYRTRGRAVRGDGAVVVAGLMVTWDVSGQSLLQAKINGARSLIAFASATYQRGSGWWIEPTLLAMWGVCEGAAPEQVIADLIVEEDRPRAEHAWAEALSSGRPINLRYTIRHGRTGKLRHLHGTFHTSLAPDGTLLWGETTHVDVTDLVRGRERTQVAVAVNQRWRDLAFRQARVDRPDHLAKALQTTAALAVNAIGDGCVMRTFGGDDDAPVATTTGHRRAEDQVLLEEWVSSTPTDRHSFGFALITALEAGGPIQSLIGQGDPKHPSWSWGNRYAIAPVLHRGRLLGSVCVFRPDDTQPYDDADLALLQVLADHIGALQGAEVASRRARQLTVELQQVNVDQRELVLQLDTIESRERGRLADALHDGPVQLAVAAMLRLDVYRARIPETDPAGEVIESILTLLETCVDEQRRLISALAPPDLSDGLGVALARFCEGIFVGTGIQAQLNAPDHVHLDPNVKEAVFLILREALLNVRKHAHATRVRLEVVESDTEVTLRLADDGVGMPAGDARPAIGHLGMSSMRARAAAVNGCLNIRGLAGVGTVVDLTVPLLVNGAPHPADANASQGSRCPSSTPPGAQVTR